MFLPIVVSFLFLVLACFTRALGNRFAGILTTAGSSIALGLCLASCWNPFDSSDLLKEDAISRATCLLASLSCLVVSLLDRRTSTLSTVCWSAGLSAIAASSTHPLLLWGAMQFSLLALMFYGRNSDTPAVPLWKRHPSLLVGSLFFGIGMLLMTGAESVSIWGLIGMVFLIVGLGGMLKWFPFPRVQSSPVDSDPIATVIGHRFLPMLTAATLCWRLAERQPFSEQQMFLLIVAGMFSLAMISVRQRYEESFSRQFSLTACSLMSLLLFPLFLQNWEWKHPGQTGTPISGLPTGESLFLAILLCEGTAILLWFAGQRQLLGTGPESDVLESLSGVVRRRPVSSLPFFVALCSLSAMPPWPGFWWRLGLLAACLLPHRQSDLTHVNERDISTVFLAALLLILLILNSLGHLRLFQRVLFDPTFRVRDHRPTATVLLAATAAGLFFLVTAMTPLSLNHLLQSSAPAPSDTPTPAQTATSQQNSPSAFLMKNTGGFHVPEFLPLP